MKTLSRVPAAFKVFTLAFIVYAISAQVWAHPISLAPHYIYLADSLLHRHVDLVQLPPTTYDLLQFNGHWYVAGSPMPSILMLPFVAVFGVNFSDVLFSLVLGAINVALVYSLLGIFCRRAQPPRPSPACRPQVGSPPGVAELRRTRADAETPSMILEETLQRSPSAVGSWTINESTRRWITLLFAFGTPHWYLAALGTYWFTAHVVAVFFSLLAVREALTRRRLFFAGAWLACAGFARPTALFLVPFFIVLIVKHSPSRSIPVRLVSAKHLSGTRHARRALLPFAAAITLGLSAHALYNYARFKSFTDFGYAYVAGAHNITSVYARYGGFNLRFLPCNLSIALLAPPEVNGFVPDFITRSCDYLLEGVNISDTSAPIVPNPMGMSIFIATPALLFILTARQRDPIIIAAWIGLLSTLIPLWMYHNTGSLQFGYRYLFDAAPMWIILLAYAMRDMTRIKRGLILVSIAINLWGFLWMFEKLIGFSWWKA